MGACRRRAAARVRATLYRHGTDDRRAPEAERARRLGGQGEGKGHVAIGPSLQVRGGRFPAMRRRHRPLQHDVTRRGPALTCLRPERHRRGLDRPHRQLQSGARGQVQIEAQRVGRARDERFAIDLRHPVPAKPGAHAGQVLAPGDDPHGLDLERGAGRVRGTDEDVPRGGRHGRGRAEDVRAHLVAGHERAVVGPRDDGNDIRFHLEVDLLRRTQEHGEVGARRRAHADLHFVHDVAVLGRRPLEVDDGKVGGGAAHETPVAGGQSLYPRPRRPDW